MTPMTLEELRELAPVYAMGALPESERLAFESAMADPAVAAQIGPELAAHRAAVEYLASAYATPAPAGLRERVLARIADEQAKPALRVEHGVRTDTSPASARVASSPERVPAQRTPSRAGWWSAGALAVALAASLVFSVDLRNQVSTLQGQLALKVAEAEQSNTTLATRDKLLATLLGTGNDVTLVRLAPGQPQGPGMQVFWNTREGKAIVSASGLAQIASTRAYALWMIRDGKPVPLALFNPDASGRAVVQDITVPTDLAGVAAFAVTEEPAAGSPQPTMTPFLVGAVPK